MNLKYGLDSRAPIGQLFLYSMQWFVLAVAVVVTSLFIAVGSPAERVLYAQKVFALVGAATIIQALWGHRMPIVVGPASVLLVGIITALASQGGDINTNKIYCQDSRILFNHLLVFPTEEMRDAFYENFKKEIEECKELL